MTPSITILTLKAKRQVQALLVAMFSLCAVTTNVHAQNYITQGFETSTFPPTSWSVVTSSGSTSGITGGPLGWARGTSGAVSTPNVTAHTGSGMAWYNSWYIRSGGVSDLITPAMNFSVYTGGTNQLSFWYYNYTYTDFLNVIVNTSASATGSSAVTLGTIVLNGMATGWHQFIYTLPSSFSSSSTVYVVFDANSKYGADQNIDDISIDHIPPCTGTPNVALIPAAGKISICAGGSTVLNGGGTVIASGQAYQWQSATSATGPWTDIAGATSTALTTPAIISVKYFRLKDSCTNSGNVGYSLADTVAPGSPAYASIPYFNDFETWQNYCTTLDVPGANWKNTPASGDGSWRRDDQGCSSGGWTTSSCYGPGSSYSISAYSPYTKAESGTHAARIHTAAGGGYLPATSTPQSGNLDLYVNCSGTGNKLLQFYFKNQPYPYAGTSYALYNNDSLDVFMSTDGGITFSQIWGADTANEWKKVRLEIPSTSATTILRFNGKRNGGDPFGYGYSDDFTDIGLDSVYVGPACNASTLAGNITPGGTVTGCPGITYNFSLAGTSLVGGLSYQWQMATSPFTTFTNIPGATSFFYNTSPIFDSTIYQVIVTCPYTTPATTATSGAAVVPISNKPSYAAINLPSPAGPGYHYSFENWNNRCSTKDAPVVASGSTVSNWANYPSTGNNSWRREDQASSAGWYYTSTSSSYLYSPVSADSSHSAHRYTYYIPTGSPVVPANLYLFVDCSTVSGGKELQYFVNTKAPTSTSYSTDTISSWFSTDGGKTFSFLRNDYNGNGKWKFVNVNLPTNSPTTVIRFQSTMSGTSSYATGVGLDLVKVLPPCSGKPTAGTLPGYAPCANENFTLQLVGSSQAAGLAYQWQQSSDGVTWTNIVGDTTMIGTFNFTTNTYVRVVVTCTNSGLSDTSNAVDIILKPFYKCYCNPTASATGSYIYAGFGNVSITKQSTGDTVLDHSTSLYPILSNPWVQSLYSGTRTALKGYTDFRDTLTPPTVYFDSLYNFYVTEGCYSSSFFSYPINIYIDYNHNGTFDDAASGELVLNKTSVSTSLPTVSDTIRIPDNAMAGLTGMRVMMGVYQSSPLAPCGPGSYNYGEIRDYLINIDYRPCTSKLDGGKATSADTIMCNGYTFKISDTTHEYHQSGISWSWQTSPDGTTWGDIPGTTNRDTLTQTFSATVWYRLKMICTNSHDTSYSNLLKVKLGAAYQCYCYSIATGGVRKDSSDIGAFTFGPLVVNKKGPHVLNPGAVGGHTSYTGTTLNLYVDSTYPVGLYHILRSATHGDAKVTLFIDYNNNLSYDIPSERVWTAYTSATDWYITTAITIPELVISDVPTGMRLILNNNVAANVPSDDACGAYTSGETMDFVVKFNRAWTTGVGTINSLENLSMYPNPSNGKFTVQFSTSNTVKSLQISVSSMTGQQVFEHSYSNTSGQFNTEIDLSNVARGVYFVSFVADGERMIRKMVIK